MGKQKKSKSGSKSASKKVRSVRISGSFGKDLIQDSSLDSSRSCFKSAISSLKGVELNPFDFDCSSDEDLGSQSSFHGGLDVESDIGAKNFGMKVMVAHTPIGESELAPAAASSDCLLTSSAAISENGPRLSTSLGEFSKVVHFGACSSSSFAAIPPNSAGSSNLSSAPLEDSGLAYDVSLGIGACPKLSKLSTSAEFTCPKLSKLSTSAEFTSKSGGFSSILNLNSNIPPTNIGACEQNLNAAESDSAEPNRSGGSSSLLNSSSHIPPSISGQDKGLNYSPEFQHPPIQFGDLDSQLHIGDLVPQRPSSGLLKFHQVRPLEFQSPISIPSKISNLGVSTWANSIVGYFFGGKKSIHFATYWAKKLWGDKVAKVFFTGNGFYIFKFSSHCDILPIVEMGHAYFGNDLIVLQKWEPSLNLSKRVLTRLPIWLKFSHVPLSLWHEEGIAYLASHFGKPLYLDEATKSGNKLSFARVCVDIEATTKIPNSIDVNVVGCDTQSISIDIPWKPSTCMHCKVYGHSDSNCTSLPRANLVGLKSAAKPIFEWKKVKARKEHSHTPILSKEPTLGESSSDVRSGNVKTSTIARTPSSVCAINCKASHQKPSMDCTTPVGTSNCKTSSSEASPGKRVHFERAAALWENFSHAKVDALSTISIPALKSCLKVSKGRKATRMIENKPP